MRKPRSIGAVAVACLCLMMLGSLIVACSPPATSTGFVGIGASSSPQATPDLNASFGQGTPAGQGTPFDPSLIDPGFNDLIPWQKISTGIQDLGFDKYPNLYEQGEDTQHQSFILYLGPGDDAAFLRDLYAFLNSPVIRATGMTPTITIVRVRTSPAEFTAAKNALLAATARLKAAGFLWVSSEPNLHTGAYDVALSAAPKGVSAATATTYLQRTVSPLIHVTSVNAAPVEFY
ncbi:MAG TPA: hypothetical protein VHV31_00770 [Nitrolancea sp.]|nr:hypothetical protein [Nitrolancea sp.]